MLPVFPFCLFSPWATSILPREGPIQKITWSVQFQALFRGMIVYPEEIQRKLKMEVGREIEREKEARMPLKLDLCGGL